MPAHRPSARSVSARAASGRVASLLLATLLAVRLAAVDNANVADPALAPLVREPVPFSASITVRNPSDRAVRVVRQDASCSCTTLKLAEDFLLPGATTTLAIEVDNRDRSGQQHFSVSLYPSDPELEPIEVQVHWRVQACVQVDVLAPQMDPLARPVERAYQDVYRYVSKERPDELRRLRKRIRLSCPPEELPAGGLVVTRIEYPGTLWAFAPVGQGDGSVLLTATARDPSITETEGLREEKVVVHTNHPDKPRIELTFITLLAKNAGEIVLDPDNLPRAGAPPTPPTAPTPAQ